MNKRRVGLIALAMMAAASGVLADDARESIDAGNEAFRQGQYDEALAEYQIVETEKPESPQLDYNIANLMHLMGKYEEALDRYNGALDSQDAGLHTSTHYNMGNTYYRMGDYQNAITSYTKALEANPDDMDAKLNLELARKMLKENMKPEEQEKQENQDQQEQEQKQDQQQQQDQQDQEQQQDQQQQNQDQQEQQQQQEQQEQQPDPKEISKEDAERILNALKDDEEDQQKKIKRQVSGGGYVGNDW